ncbi:MAG: hypothetical protein IJ160_11945, partial [Muribaculaceae bacterium]|nr:hypothetical protein [Muribaculaceae bacterium]
MTALICTFEQDFTNQAEQGGTASYSWGVAWDQFGEGLWSGQVGTAPLCRPPRPMVISFQPGGGHCY